jgi:hypothetical protein
MVVGEIIPSPLKPFFDLLVLLPITYYRRSCANLLNPVYPRRVGEYYKIQKLGGESTRPDDLLFVMAHRSVGKDSLPGVEAVVNQFAISVRLYQM